VALSVVLSEETHEETEENQVRLPPSSRKIAHVLRNPGAALSFERKIGRLSTLSVAVRAILQIKM